MHRARWRSVFVPQARHQSAGGADRVRITTKLSFEARVEFQRALLPQSSRCPRRQPSTDARAQR